MGLSPLMVKEVFQIIEAIRKEGTTLLLVEQNARMALKSADRGYVLENGLVVFQDTAARLGDSPMVKEAYLGG